MAEPLHLRAADLRDGIRLATRDLDKLAAEARTARPRLGATTITLEVYGAAALVHGYYTHLERFFERIVRDLNTAPLAGPDWHRRLLLSMTLDRPGTRPAVLTDSVATALDELLRFRHLFRNLYVLDLQVVKVAAVVDRLLELHPRIVASLQQFDEFLASIEAQA